MARNKIVLKPSIRRTYPGSPSELYFAGRKKRAMEKGKIIIIPQPQVSVLPTKIQRHKRVATGRENFGLLATVLLLSFSMLLHGRENGKITRKQELKLGTGMGITTVSTLYFSKTFADFNEGYQARFLILGLLFLTIGVLIFLTVWKNIK